MLAREGQNFPRKLGGLQTGPFPQGLNWGHVLPGSQPSCSAVSQVGGPWEGWRALRKRIGVLEAWLPGPSKSCSGKGSERVLQWVSFLGISIFIVKI